MKKRIVKVSMITASCFVIAYIAVSLWASFSILNLMKNAEEQQAYSEDFKGIISKECYKRLNHEGGYHTEKSIKEYTRSFPLSFHTFCKAKITYYYTCIYRDNDSGTIQSGSWDVPVTITAKLKDWKWVVEDVYEKP